MILKNKLKYYLPLDFARWWWSPIGESALTWQLHFWKLIILYTIDLFSIQVLIPAILTLKPWKKDDHWVGRFMGFWIRLMFVSVGIVACFFVLLVAIFSILFWILLPFLAVMRIFFIAPFYITV